jgi:hypothetical protein
MAARIVTLFYGGEFITLSPCNEVKGILEENGIITKLIESTLEIDRLMSDENVRKVRLNGCVVPGFVMSHTHFSTYSILTKSVRVSPMNLFFDENYSPPKTSDEVLHRLKESVCNSDDIFAQGYEPVLQTGKIIDRNDLDLVSDKICIYLMSASMHTIYVNTQVLLKNGLVDKILGGIVVTDKVPEGADEEVMKGALSEENLLLISATIPKISPNELRVCMEHAINLLRSQGITTLSDATVQDTMFSFYKDLAMDMKYGVFPKMRIIGFPVYSPKSPFLVPSHGGLIQLDFKSFYNSDFLTVGPMKVIGDGSVQGYTAYLNQPYYSPPFFEVSNPDEWRGQYNYPRIDLRVAFQEILGCGMNLAVHGNGDGDIDLILDALEKVGEKIELKGRVRIEHSSLITVSQLIRCRFLGIHTSFLNHHIYYYGDVFRERVLGPARTDRIHPAGTATEMGVSWDLHSDCPVSPPCPLFEMWTAVNRSTSSGIILCKEERVSAMEALKACTIYSALSLGIGDKVGSLEVGKFADFTVLSDNPITIDPKNIRDIIVLQTHISNRT